MTHLATLMTHLTTLITHIDITFSSHTEMTYLVRLVTLLVILRTFIVRLKILMWSNLEHFCGHNDDTSVVTLVSVTLLWSHW